MKKFVRTLISSTLICFAYAGTALGVQVNIDPAAYTGLWILDDGQDQRGVVSFDLATGSHSVRVGGADDIFFNVTVNGTVTVENDIAATGGGDTLTFNTTTIKVNPVSFNGNWRVSAGATPDLSGVQFVTLVPGLRFYSLEVGATGGFFFHIAGDGTVTVQNDIVATGGVGKLKLKNTGRKFINE